ncbi:MAG: hypothetical protein D6814_05460, partial [Calditrichaeota bacterium]
MRDLRTGLLLCVVYVWVAGPAAAWCQDTMTDLLQPVTLVAGEADTLRVEDLFYAETYPLRFAPHPHIRVRYNAASRQVILTPQAHFEGLTLLGFNLGTARYHLPVFCRIRQRHTFRFRPGRRPQSLAVMGSFNNWNRHANPMKDPDGDGVYEATLPLDPGRYEYKFVLNGREFADPANPDSVSNPFGSYNSVLTLRPRHRDKMFLHVMGFDAGNKESRFYFRFQREHPPAPITRQNVVALLDNRAVPPQS